MKKFYLMTVLLLSGFYASAQNDVMMQAFYWDVPVDVNFKNGTWWDNLKSKSLALKISGITGVWIPSPAKGNFGIYDMGYGIFDHYDLGNYNQKGTVETRFGSRAELESMIQTFHNNGVDVYADIVPNHIFTNDDQDEVNPVVKNYVRNKAIVGGNQFTPYPTNEIKWVIKNAAVGDYYLQVHGYQLLNAGIKTECGYDLGIDYAGTGIHVQSDAELLHPLPIIGDQWVWEPNAANNGGGPGNYGDFPASGYIVRGHIDGINDIDEYKFHVSSATDVVIRLTPRREASNPWKWDWADSKNGYYPAQIWFNGTDIAPSLQLEAHTNTGIKYVNHNGAGEANFSWNYSLFHPADNNDFLTNDPGNGPTTNTKIFGNDINTYNPTVLNFFQNWGKWLVNTPSLGFDGFRMDFVRGYDYFFTAEWIKSLPLKNGKQRFVVGENWDNPFYIKKWVNDVAGDGADVHAFDFPLKWTLNSMCNGNAGSFDMSSLNHAGMVRNDQGSSLSGLSVVTWVDNHDTGKEHDKWIWKDFKMGYAYILTHEGRPCIFYNHFFGDTMTDNNDNSLKVVPDPTLRTDIEKLMFVRKNYLDGTLAVLSEVGNPFSPDNEGTSHVYVARRQGNGLKDGAIVVINNHDTQERGLWVDSSQPGFVDWATPNDAIKLVNAFDPNDKTTVYGNGGQPGRVFVKAPPRGYAVYVKESDFIPYAPFSTNIWIDMQVTDTHTFQASEFNFNGQAAFSAIKIVSLPSNGSLKFNGAAMVQGQEYPFPNGTLVYTPDLKLSTSFTFQVKDGNGFWSNSIYTANIKVHCTAPSNLQNTQLNPFEATFTWNPVAGIPSYELYYQINGSNNWSTWSTPSTSMKLYDLDPGIQYTAKVTSLCYSADREFSSDLPFQTPAYCKTGGQDASKDWIEYVKLDFPGQSTPGFIDNKSGSNGGYIFFAPTYQTYEATKFYQLDVTPGGVIPNETRFYKAWIDYNHNGIFDAGELVMDLTAQDLKPQSAGFTIPSNAQAGATVLRIAMSASNQITDACTVFNFGEVEDYRIWIKNPNDNDLIGTGGATTDLVIFPNPGDDRVTIRGNYRESFMEVHDSYGNFIGAININGTDPLVDLSPLGLRSGNIYIINVGTQSTRFIRN